MTAVAQAGRTRRRTAATRKLDVPRICALCGAPFLSCSTHINAGRGKFCGKSCADANMRKAVYAGIIEDNSIPEPNSGCWLWMGALTGAGYGQIRIGRVWLAHRLSYVLAHGEILSSAPVIRHRCDNTACVNPDHLVAGTTKDNGQDTATRGRTNRGSARWNAKLKEADIPAIREALAKGISIEQVARTYGVNSRAITVVRDGSGWRHV